MWGNKELKELLTHHIKTTQMCLDEIVELKKKDNELTEQLIRMDGRIELSIEHAEMGNMKLLQKVESDLGTSYVTKAELGNAITKIVRERERDVSTVKLLVWTIGLAGTIINWLISSGVVHV